MEIREKFLESLQAVSKTVMIFGVIIILLGVLSIVLPSYSGMAITVVVGIMLIIGGALRTIFAFVTTSWSTVFLRLLFGLIMLIGGVWIIVNPDMGTEALTVALAVIFIIDGIQQVIFSFFLRPIGGGGIVLLGGIFSILVGALVWAKWPASGEWALGLLVGIKLLFDGIALLTLGLVGKKIGETA